MPPQDGLNRAQPGLEVPRFNDWEKEATSVPHPSTPNVDDRRVVNDGPHYPAANPSSSVPPPSKPANPQSTILGLRRSTFFLILVLILVIILATAIGGGVGGSQAHKNNQEASPNAQNSSDAGAAPDSAAPATTTVTASSPSQTPLTDCPGSNGTTFNSPTQGLTNLFLKLCSTFVGSGDKLAFGPMDTFDNCIVFCDSLRRPNTPQSHQDMNAVEFDRPGTAGGIGYCWCYSVTDYSGLGKSETDDSAVLVKGPDS